MNSKPATINLCGVPERVKNAIRAGIRNGSYPPGELLPSDNTLAAQFGCGRSSVITALQTLEKEGLLLRQHGKGSFVAPDAEIRLKYRHFVLCREVPETLTADYLGITTEIYHGAIEEAQNCNVNLNIMHFSRTDDPMTIERQYEQLADADGVIFMGEELEKLQRKVNDNNQQILKIPSSPIVPALNDDLVVTLDIPYMCDSIFKYIAAVGYRNCVILEEDRSAEPYASSALFQDYKVSLLTSRLIGSGIGVERLKFTRNLNKLNSEIEDWIKTGPHRKYELIVISYTHSMMPLYQAMFRHGLKPGSDLDLLGICAATTTINLYPEPSFYNVFYREVGRHAVSLLRSAVDGHAPERKLLLRGEMSIGETSRPLPGTKSSRKS